MGFQITQKLETGLEVQRLLYIATTDDEKQTQILVKFTRRYSKELHEFCASIKHAPELFGFERLPGDWIGVAMEYFPSESADRILESNGLRSYGGGWLKDIDKVVSAFHSQGYVHGDLRPPNFVVNHDMLYLIDFDWGGREGEVEFPEGPIHPVLRDGPWQTLITKELDERVMEYTKRCVSEEIKLARSTF